MTKKRLTPKERVIAVIEALPEDANSTDALRALHRAFPKEVEKWFDRPGGPEFQRLIEREEKSALPDS